MTRYEIGKRFEDKVRAGLIADGYVTVRSGGSRSAVDIVALKPGQVVLIQAKRSNPLIPRPERIELVRLAQLCAGLPVVAYQPAPRKPVEYRVLTGIGPKDFERWSPDEVGAE